VDGLLCALGSLRNASQHVDPSVRQKDREAVDQLIAEAAKAVAESVEGGESDARLAAACEALVLARDGIESLSTAKPLREVDGRDLTLRRKAARLLFERIRGGSGGW
jgi:hypothetical protein